MAPPDQVERFDAGVLPPREFSRLAKGRLFAALDAAIYVPLTDSDVGHSEDCYEARVKFAASEHDGPLTAEHWSRLQEIRAAAPEGARIEVRSHRGYCESPGCEAKPVKRLSVRVTVEWAGESYAREYSID